MPRSFLFPGKTVWLALAFLACDGLRIRLRADEPANPLRLTSTPSGMRIAPVPTEPQAPLRSIAIDDVQRDALPSIVPQQLGQPEPLPPTSGHGFSVNDRFGEPDLYEG